ncbi:Fur family transcriptional regulator [Rothia sp. P3C3.S176]|uniref:Fur family transcriptional regulator n=1 Tax=Rothia sp. P3C3.S176 TaxID=2962204 RepID=UPI00273A5B03|nr:Fur family transcriptional regulator [Rothia sp. P3C3.S176]
MTDAKTTQEAKTTQLHEHQNNSPGCAHTIGLPMLSAMSPEQLEEAWTTGLRTKGRRVTKQRLAVLHSVQEHPHSTAETIVQAVRERIPAITVQSVYVILTDLTDIDLLRKFEPPGTPALYETRTGDNHHHAFCVRCGKVEDVDCAVGSAPCLTPSDFHGMALFSADVLYQGVCVDCQTEAEAELANSQVQAAASVQH